MKKFVCWMVLMVMACSFAALAEDHGNITIVECGLAEDFVERFSDDEVELFHSWGRVYEDGYQEAYIDIGDHYSIRLDGADDSHEIIYSVLRYGDTTEVVKSYVITEDWLESEEQMNKYYDDVVKDIKACLQLNERWA